MARRSAASLEIKVDGKPNRLKAPFYLDANEREVFADLVASCDATHFRPSDLPLLARYAESIVLGQRAAKELRSGAVVNGKPSP